VNAILFAALAVAALAIGAAFGKASAVEVAVRFSAAALLFGAVMALAAVNVRKRLRSETRMLPHDAVLVSRRETAWLTLRFGFLLAIGLAVLTPEVAAFAGAFSVGAVMIALQARQIERYQDMRQEVWYRERPFWRDEAFYYAKTRKGERAKVRFR
jgi:amino acid transporter